MKKAVAEIEIETDEGEQVTLKVFGEWLKYYPATLEQPAEGGYYDEIEARLDGVLWDLTPRQIDMAHDALMDARQYGGYNE